jgi:hypothetical protein
MPEEDISLKQSLWTSSRDRAGVVSLCKKWNLMSRLNVRYNGSKLNLSLSQQEGLSAQAIHDELVQVLGADAIAYSTVTCYLRQSQ